LLDGDEEEDCVKAQDQRCACELDGTKGIASGASEENDDDINKYWSDEEGSPIVFQLESLLSSLPVSSYSMHMSNM